MNNFKKSHILLLIYFPHSFLNISLIWLNVVFVEGGPDGVLVNQASAEWCLTGSDIVGTQLEEALLAPVGAPGVPHDPVVTAAAPIDLLVRLHSSVAHYEDTMVDLVVGAAASEVLLCDDARVVAAEAAGGSHTS